MNNLTRKYFTIDEVDEIRIEAIKDGNETAVGAFQLGLVMGLISGMLITLLVQSII